MVTEDRGGIVIDRIVVHDSLFSLSLDTSDMIGNVSPAAVAVLAIIASALVFRTTAAALMAAPTVYEHYTKDGITSGLRGENENFYLNERKLMLHSGALHYFRVHPSYWRDRLRKLRAAGIVAVETYVPWNLHEPYKGVYDFGKGGEDMSPFLDIQQFLKIAKEEDLLAIVRPGPYICAEWEFGGLPSWLLRERDLKIRTSDPSFIAIVKQYFDNLLPILKDLQFTKGGSIIAFQIENEYGNAKQPGVDSDIKYLEDIKKLFEDHGLVELLFTSDTPSFGQKYGALPGVLMTANFNKNATQELTLLNSWQPDKPSMVMEYWSGWFDHWGEEHNTVSPKDFASVLEEILDFPAHVNFYMFHGGTTFGFLNGANVAKKYPFYIPDISSYDYDAPLTEAGDYTAKYHSASALLASHQPVALTRPNLPSESVKEKYVAVNASGILDWNAILKQVPSDEKQTSTDTMYMEFLNINNNSGQSYGYISYRTNVKPTQGQKVQLKISDVLKGVAMVIIDGKRKTPPLQKTDDYKGFGYWIARDSTFDIDANGNGSTVDIVVENWGRNNFGTLNDFNETRGLAPKQLLIDGKAPDTWQITALQFKGKWIRSLSGWSPVPKNDSLSGPLLLLFELNVEDPPRDTFLDMRGWGKGVVFINGFNLGRFCNLGPVRTLYIPAPLLKSGSNQVVVFEHFTPPKDEQGKVVLKFSKNIIFESISENPIKISFSSE